MSPVHVKQSLFKCRCTMLKSTPLQFAPLPCMGMHSVILRETSGILLKSCKFPVKLGEACPCKVRGELQMGFSVFYTGVAFWLTQYSTTPPRASVDTWPLPTWPLGCAVHAKWCVLHNPGVYTIGYSVWKCPLCVLENGGRIRMLHRSASGVSIP